MIKKSKYGILLHGRKKISGGKKVIKWLKKHLAFDKNKDADIQLKESTRALKNPGCGWYHIYTFDLSKENFLYIDCEEEELVLLLIDIHAFRGCEQIPKEALEYFSSILTFFQQHDKGIIDDLCILVNQGIIV